MQWKEIFAFVFLFCNFYNRHCILEMFRSVNDDSFGGEHNNILHIAWQSNRMSDSNNSIKEIS